MIVFVRTVTLILVLLLMIGCEDEIPDARPDDPGSLFYFERDLNKKLEMGVALLANGTDSDRYIYADEVALTAYLVGNLDLAFETAKLALELDNVDCNCTHYVWNHGNVVHDANMVLGLVAVARSNIELGAEHLLLAGATPGSPQLNSFGPNMRLAKTLLEAGEKDAVVKYLESCKLFWKSEDGRLDSWIAAIRGGGMPYFRHNIH